MKVAGFCCLCCCRKGKYRVLLRKGEHATETEGLYWLSPRWHFSGITHSQSQEYQTHPGGSKSPFLEAAKSSGALDFKAQPTHLTLPPVTFLNTPPFPKHCCCLVWALSHPSPGSSLPPTARACTKDTSAVRGFM